MNTPVASPDLLPCPFCGGEAAMHNYPADEDTTWWFAQCGDCGARNGEQLAADAPDQEFAIEAWNRRALASPAPSAGVGVKEMFILNREYRTRGGDRVKLVSIHNPGTEHETMACTAGVHRYTRRLHPLNFGRVTGTDGTDPRDLHPASEQGEEGSAPSVEARP